MVSVIAKAEDIVTLLMISRVKFQLISRGSTTMINFEAKLTDAVDNHEDGMQISYWNYEYPGTDYLYNLCESVGDIKGANITWVNFSPRESDKFDLVFYIEY